jgi:hypothetical protein
VVAPNVIDSGLVDFRFECGMGPSAPPWMVCERREAEELSTDSDRLAQFFRQILDLDLSRTEHHIISLQSNAVVDMN